MDHQRIFLCGSIIVVDGCVFYFFQVNIEAVFDPTRRNADARLDMFLAEALMYGMTAERSWVLFVGWRGLRAPLY